MIVDRTTERQFLQQLLVATRASKALWTGTIKPGCYQYNAGEYLLAIAADPAHGFTLSLHHASGNPLEILTPALLAAGGEQPDLKADFAELYELARIQALNLRRRWRRLTAELRNGSPAQQQAGQD
jgi:hypothetical protein